MNCKIESIRKTELRDIPAILDIYNVARKFMRETGNTGQWIDGYPSEQQLKRDIDAGGSYVITDETGKVCATFFFVVGEDPTYSVIEDGNWLDDAPYGVIHRIASDGTTHGVLRTTLDFCFTLVDNIRIDTHRDNKVMQKNLVDYGFGYCGIIHLANGDERLAYQLHRAN